MRTSGKHKVVGILGGMGPEATVDLYRAIISQTPAKRDQDHIPTIIYSNPEIPDRSESVLHRQQELLPYLIEGVVFLEHAGADLVVIPCNTAHYYIEDLRQGVRIPILSIIEETVAAAAGAKPTPACVGIMATRGTREMNLYGKCLKRTGIPYIYPDEFHQSRVTEAVYAVKSGLVPEGIFDSLVEICEHLKSGGADALILGCTELPIIAHQCDLILPVYECTRILAAAAVAAATV